MEIILVVATILGGFAAMVYFVEKVLSSHSNPNMSRLLGKFRSKKKLKPDLNTMQNRSSNTELLVDLPIDGSNFDQESISFFLALFKSKDFVFVHDVRDTGAPYTFLGKLSSAGLVDITPDRGERTYYLTNKGKAFRKKWVQSFRV